MKTLILVSMTLILTACGAPLKQENSDISSNELVSTVLSCKLTTFVTGKYGSLGSIEISYSLETFEDGHNQAYCSTTDSTITRNLTCLDTNPYNYSYEYFDNSNVLQIMNVTVGIETDPIACRLIKYE